jgi:uncharacterized protein YciI
VFVVELAFDDGPERIAARPAHRKRLRDLYAAGVVVGAGPFSDESGALLIFDVPSEEALAEIIDADPYYRTNGVTVVRRQRWSPVILRA